MQLRTPCSAIEPGPTLTWSEPRVQGKQTVAAHSKAARLRATHRVDGAVVAGEEVSEVVVVVVVVAAGGGAGADGVGAGGVAGGVGRMMEAS